MAKAIKKLLVNIPVLGPLGHRLSRGLRDFGRRLRNKQPAPFQFSRMHFDPASASPGTGPEQVRVMNLLSYTKTSQSAYNGEAFPAGYHSIELPGLSLAGQRNPRQRIPLIPFDFRGKVVLDIGSNQGGMLFALADQIRHGVGIDYDHRLVNAANKVRSHARVPNIDFYVFDLEKEDLNLIRDFLPADKVDVVFLLAVCVWIQNWRDVVRFAASIAESMVFEANGKVEQQQEQVDLLHTLYQKVQLLQERSVDDPLQKKRKLYWCSNNAC